MMHPFRAKVLAGFLMVESLLLRPPSAEAATASGSFNVSVTIVEACSVTSATSTTLDFGGQALLNANIDGSTTIQVQCTSGTSYDVTLDNGLNASRRMRLSATSNYVDYELYKDTARSIIWPTTATAAPYAYTATGAAQNITVYGRIPAQATPPASATAYTDTIGITITY